MAEIVMAITIVFAGRGVGGSPELIFRCENHPQFSPLALSLVQSLI